MMNLWNKKGFTLIELLVVVAIIGLLASVVMVSLNSARSKARDAERKATLKQLANANELYMSANGVYAPTAGWIANWNPNSNPLAPTYIPTIKNDPLAPDHPGYVYWRGDYPEPTCSNPAINPADLDINKFYFYAKLENPTAQDLATFSSNSLDQCIKNLSYGFNYKVGN